MITVQENKFKRTIWGNHTHREMMMTKPIYSPVVWKKQSILLLSPHNILLSTMRLIFQHIPYFK